MNTRQRLKRIDPYTRFMSQVEEDDYGYESLCWIWKGGVTYNGYGRFSTGYLKPHTYALAHKWLYEETVGPLPEGMTDLDHLCLVKLCVNPAHLEPVTRSENSTRKVGRVYAWWGR